jgi:hypothetical protein
MKKGGKAWVEEIEGKNLGSIGGDRKTAVGRKTKGKGFAASGKSENHLGRKDNGGQRLGGKG